ncbi:MAG: SDR family oxidoreductase [Ferruginibacter sp.]|nr:SDR family oxidoreductase [Cytophagales bacterium]
MITENLKNKHVVIVGGSSGIGRAVARIAHELGARVTLTGTGAPAARATAQTIGAEVQSAALDVNDEQQVNGFFAQLPAIDHVYVAAGSTKLGGILEGDLDQLMAPFHERLVGSVRVVRAAAGKINPGGSITFTGGVSTDRPVPGAWVSGIGTAAAEQLARVMALELAPIRFNAVAPGYTDTPMWDKVLGENKRAVLEGVAGKLPVRKIATPEEVASAVVFMMVNLSITGEIIHVDGGARLV